MPTDFRSTVGGDGTVIADAFQNTSGVNIPKVVVNTTVTFDPPSLAAGATSVTTEIALTGVEIGDAIELYPPYATNGVMHQADPSSSGGYKITLFNASAVTVNLASGSWGVVVRRRS